MNKALLIISVVTIFAGCNPTPYSTDYNLDFEYTDDGVTPTRWELSDSAISSCETGVSSEHQRHGMSSLKMVLTDTSRYDYGYFCQELPLGNASGKIIELSGWIKTWDVRNGFADFWIVGNDESDYTVMFEDLDERGVRNTSGWKQISIKKRISDSATYAMFGGVLTGSGIAWFDNLELTIDGVKYEDTFIPAPKTKLSKADKSALMQYIHPLRTCTPGDGTTEDLKELVRLIGDSKIVALGEPTHGSSEVFTLKNRLIQYLAANEGFGVFAIEAGVPECYLLNEYIHNGKGDSKQRIAAISCWGWNTQEMLDLVEWMKHYNSSGSGITYTGFDMQAYEGAAAALVDAFKDNKQVVAILEKLKGGFEGAITYSPIGVAKIEQTTATAFLHELQLLKHYLAKSSFDEPQKAWLLQQATLLEQFAGQSSIVWRDRCMADNLLWIKNQNPDSRIIAWAHNAHIQNSDGWMGNCLKDRLGEDYTTVGFTFYNGSYTAAGPDGLTAYQAQQAHPGTLEHLLGQLNEPLFVLDLKKMRADNAPALKWLNNLKYRDVGAVKQQQEFVPEKIADKFDFLIFIRETTPSKLLK